MEINYQNFDIFDLLCEIKPDFIMVHGLGSLSALQVKKYVRVVNKDCVVTADNHLDINNCDILKSRRFKHMVLRFLWKVFTFPMCKVYAKVYGVTPDRAFVASKYFGIPPEKLDVLPAGADDEEINFSNSDAVRCRIRSMHSIDTDDFLIVTGGKIDIKKNVHLVMEAIKNIDVANIKLLVFGECSDDIKETVENVNFKQKERVEIKVDSFVGRQIRICTETTEFYTLKNLQDSQGELISNQKSEADKSIKELLQLNVEEFSKIVNYNI